MTGERKKDITLFFNIGDRDVKIDGKEIPKKEARSRGKEILDNYHELKQKMSFELVSPLLERFKQEANKAFLFVTNQEDPEFRKQDTLFFGRIIQRFVEEEYGIECEMKEYPWKPTDYSLAFHFFSNFFKDFDDSFTKVISTSGGVAAMKFSMQTVASSLFNNVEFYSVDEKTHEVKTVDIENTLKKELVKRAAIELLKRYDYAGIINLLENNHIENRKIRLLLEYAHNRLCFNFDTANAKINEFVNALPSLDKEEYEKLKINFSDKRTFINELFQNMAIKWENGEYVDFIGRLYRFNEALLQLVFERETNYEIKWQSKEEGNKQFTEALSNYPDLKNKIHSRRNIPKEEKIKADVGALEICFNHFVEKDGKRWGPIRKIYNNNPKMDDHSTKKLVDEFRHYTIVAHGFNGVSKDDIVHFYGSEQVIEDLRTIVNLLSSDENMFNKINTILNKRIKEL